MVRTAVSHSGSLWCMLYASQSVGRSAESWNVPKRQPAGKTVNQPTFVLLPPGIIPRPASPLLHGCRCCSGSLNVYEHLMIMSFICSCRNNKILLTLLLQLFAISTSG